MPDPLRSTMAYLRLWKACDVYLALAPKQDSARRFEVVPFDADKIGRDLELLVNSDLKWAEDAEDLRADLQTVLQITRKKLSKDKKKLAAVDLLRKKFQEKALFYSEKMEVGRSA